MAVFAISDLHMPGHDDKPMDVFGTCWEHHVEKIISNWEAMIDREDLVLLPGDLSWAMQFSEVMDDLQTVANLPGKKVLLRGNHDYWWSTPAKLRSAFPQSLYLVQNDAVCLNDYTICGTRGWLVPTGNGSLKPDDQRIYQRELIRLELSLKAAQKKVMKEIIVMLHYPPLLADGLSTGFTELLEAYGIRHVVYGHLHGKAIETAFIGNRNGVNYHLVSSDSLRFSPLRLFD